ncbi:hypothetical protein [Sulfuricystis multivorans]|uniref:hypothetical protein n=1 Tax=Sulfuricystis multivorans TaxID=2211108 RepID=UPI000F833B9A|nr:hypothetical protein [Sulfuricystis multivorans]
MSTWLITIVLVFALMIGGIVVDRFYRAFAARHPQLGPFRKNEGGCGCCGSKCDKPDAGCTD